MADDSLFHVHADAYAAQAETHPANRDYDRPTLLRLAGDLDGRRVVELGCAAGGLTAHLVEHGADVTAVDAQPHMVALARQRLGRAARFVVADLERPPLDLAADASIHLVVGSLVLHYVRDWAPLLAELHRYLRPGGALVLSLHHPITGWLRSDQTDYHRTEMVSETWELGDQPATARIYRRSLSSIFGPLLHAGFTVEAVEEPRLEPTGDLPPDMLRTLNSQPLFLFIRAVAARRGR